MTPLDLKENLFMSSLMTVLAYIYGLIGTPLFWIIVFLSAIDFILGIYAAFKRKKINWNICLEGIGNKVYIGFLILISAMIDFALMAYGINTKGIFHNFIMASIIARELGSIITNAEKAKLWIPEILKIALNKIKEISKGEKRNG